MTHAPNTDWQLAEINIARLKYEIGDPRVAKFVDNVDRVNGIAERSQGFIWRNAAETSGPIQGDCCMIATVSVWASMPEFEGFVWDTLHRQFFQNRADWFEVLDSMHFAMWWVESGTRPSLKDALERLDHINAHGNTDHAFGWDHLPEATRWRDMHTALQQAG